MTDDLVKRLREAGRQYVDNEYNLHALAADRIEELEKALRLIADTDPAGDQHWPGRIARAALEEGQDEMV